MIWVIIKRIALVITVIAGIIAICTGVYNFFFSPKGKLIARVEFSNIKLPVTFEKSAIDFYDSLNTKQIKNILTDAIKTPLDSNFTGEASSAIVKYLRANKFIDSLNQCLNIKGIWSVEVLNQRNVLSSSVSINLPEAILASIAREGHQPELIETLGVINIGDLKPRESVSIIAWTNYNLSEYRARDIKITHNDGVGRVILMIPVGPFWSFMSRSWSSVLIMLVGVIGIYSNIKYSRKSKTNQHT